MDRFSQLVKKKIYYLWIFTLLSSLFISSSVFAEEDKQALIDHIKSHFDQINQKLQQLNHVVVLLNNYSKDGALLDGYLQAATAQMIRVEVLNGTTPWNGVCYFKDGQLIFAYRKKLRYDQPYGKVLETKEDRLFFLEGKLISYIDGSEEKMNPEIEADAKHLLHDAMLFAKALTIPPGPVDFKTLEKSEQKSSEKNAPAN